MLVDRGEHGTDLPGAVASVYEVHAGSKQQPSTEGGGLTRPAAPATTDGATERGFGPLETAVERAVSVSPVVGAVDDVGVGPVEGVGCDAPSPVADGVREHLGAAVDGLVVRVGQVVVERGCRPVGIPVLDFEAGVVGAGHVTVAERGRTDPGHRRRRGEQRGSGRSPRVQPGRYRRV